MGMIFNIKRYGIHDGPGIRTTVFLKGCPLNCLWCHNPEGIAEEQEFMWWEGRCIGCGSCQSVCPKDCISFADDCLQLNQDQCDLCGVCVDACTSQALELVGKEMTVTQVLGEIERDMIFYDESGGGVTLSGGEPLMQPDFSHSILKSCKKLKIHTTVDTCGHAQFYTITKMCDYVDLVLYDIKVINNEKHEKLTGTTNELILENLKTLSRNRQKLIVRFPLIPGVNDHERDILEFGEFVSSLSTVTEVSLLPYHKAGVEKNKRLINSRTSSFMNRSISPEKLGEIEEKLKTFGLKIQIGV